MSVLNPVFSHEDVQYRDGKRHAWVVSLLVPASLGSGPFLYQATGSVWSLWIPVLLVYGMIPLLDLRARAHALACLPWQRVLRGTS
jgi:hypothetical protein